MSVLRPYMHMLERCEFPENVAGARCTRCRTPLDSPLEPDQFLSCRPGCEIPHPYRLKRAPFDKRESVPLWSFNGDLARPTFEPSLLVHERPGYPRCHLFVRDGRIEFCGDCGHPLAGKTVDMVPFPPDS